MRVQRLINGISKIFFGLLGKIGGVGLFTRNSIITLLITLKDTYGRSGRMSDLFAREENMKTFLNPYEIWKKAYFLNESSISSIIREGVETQAFANFIDLVLNSYLQYLKLYNQLCNQWVNYLPFATRYDTARVAKLVVSLENKVDRIEDQMLDDLLEIKEDISQIRLGDEKNNSINFEELDKKIDKTLNGIKRLTQKTNTLEKTVKSLEGRLQGT